MNVIREWLRIKPESKPRIYSSIFADAELLNFTYWLGILFSAGIATLGLVENSPAVIIGAMLISPLMGPIMATGLGLAAGDFYLTAKALFKLLASLMVAIALSGLLVWGLPFHSATSEILARTNPTMLDLGIALLSGLAGAVAVNRAGDGVTTLPGVAIAVALMPPLCAVGFGVGSGWNTAIMAGAGLLFLTNLVAIVFSGFLLFLLTGMNSDEARAGLAQLSENDPLAQRFTSGRLHRVVRAGSRLRWRVLLLLLLLGALAFPLQIALRQLAGEAVARDVVQRVVKSLVPARALLTQQTEVGRNTISIRLISTHAITEERRAAAEAEIARRSGRSTELSVQTVASQTELKQLVDKLAAQPATAVVTPVAAAPEPFSEMSIATRTRMEEALKAAWPETVPLAGFEIMFTATGPHAEVRYESAKALDPVALELIQNSLREKLSSPKLMLDVTRKTPARRGRAKR